MVLSMNAGLDSLAIKRRVGYLPGELMLTSHNPPLSSWLQAQQSIRHCGKLISAA